MDAYFSLNDDTKIAYTLSGRGPFVVLPHCWAGNRRFWKEQIPFLQKNHTVLALDFRGHGKSDVPGGGYTLEQLAEDAHQVMQGVAVGLAAVVGHSMGGMVAQQLYIRHSNDVSCLILIATTSADPDDNLTSKRVKDATPQIGYENAFRQHTSAWFTPQSDPDLVKWLYSQMLRTPQEATLALVESFRRLDFRSELPTFHVPTLVIGAEGDGTTPPIRSEEMAKLIPGARLIVIDRVGHFGQFESTKEVNQAIGDFLSKHAFKM